MTGYIGYDGPDPVAKAMLDNLNTLCVAYRNIETELAAGDGDKEAAFKSWMETSDNAQAAKLRTTIENATKKLRELAEANVTFKVLTEEEKTKYQVELDDLKTKIKAGQDVAKSIINSYTSDREAVEAAYATIENPVKSSRGRKPGEAGSKLPRVSATVTVTGGNYEKPEVFDTFSAAAMGLNVEVKDLQLAFAKAAGVAHENIKSVDKPVEFTFQPHENGAVYTLRTEPKERAPRGSKKKEESEEKTESPENTEDSDQAASAQVA